MVHRGELRIFPVLDPQTNTATKVMMPVRDADMESTKTNTMAASPIGARRRSGCADQHAQSMMDDEATSGSLAGRPSPTIRPSARPARAIPSAQVFPIKASTRHLAYYNPKTGDTKLIRTCFNTHHLVSRKTPQHPVDQRRGRRRWCQSGG